MYLKLILPLALKETYHYEIDDSLLPADATALVGCRAIVSFGRKRFYTGIIAEVQQVLPEGASGKNIKHVNEVLDQHPLVDRPSLELWQWIAEYYHCSIGQVMRSALPSGLRPESKTLITLNPDFVANSPLSTEAYSLLDCLQTAVSEGLSLEVLESRTGLRLSKVYAQLIALGAIHSEETVVSRYKPKLKPYLRLQEPYRSELGLRQATQELGRATKQIELLGAFVHILEEQGLSLESPLPRLSLSHGDSSRASIIKKLLDKQIFELCHLEESRIGRQDNQTKETRPSLNTSQLPELSKSVSYLESKDLASKELAIISLVSEYIQRGKQVLLLSPSAYDSPSAGPYLEALTSVSQGTVYYYHPQESEAKRTEVYKRLSTSSEACLIIGTGSSIFLPLKQLGLIIVDEEQEYLYKQQFVAPYYHARDVALYLGAKRSVQVVLAGATPSAEALFNMLRGKYQRIKLPSDEPTLLPEIQVIDLKKQKAQGLMPYGRSISRALQEAIQRELIEGRRVLLLQNRRGYAPYLRCEACQKGIDCPHCDVSLNYYASHRQLRCHYCAYTRLMPSQCPHCSAQQVDTPLGPKPALSLIGYGSERIEEEVQELFPEARVLRVDSDSLQSQRRRKELHEQIAAGDVDIIVGTQLMKGQPLWSNVGLIAVVQLDGILSYPDFRSEESAYQLLYQLMLRSASSSAHYSAKLILQTSDPEHPFIQSLKHKDYEGFIKGELALRQMTQFPPFTRLSCIRLKGFDEKLLERVGEAFVLYLREYMLGISVSNLQTPSIARIEGQYIREIICRRPYQLGYQTEREAMQRAEVKLRHFYPEASRLQIHYDIDPL